MKKIIYILTLFSLVSCSISSKKCIDNDFVFINSLDYQTIVNTCDYNKKLKERIYEYGFISENFYYLSRINLDIV
ncbi:MAG: hypothetical protein LBD88_05105 [Candidatus Peribacteria bacterium]|nr:hypothetical protein [Candidatus Peribacteria bacterium]